MTVVTRKIVRIDEEKCDGCELCVPSCAEGAIQIIDGKAKLVADNLCDGIGNCLGTCPRDAIIIEERPAEEFDEVAVEQHLGENQAPLALGGAPECGCPGAMLRQLAPGPQPVESAAGPAPRRSALRQWPVQLTLLPPVGRLWEDADVLIAADCVPVTVPDFHESMLAGKTLAIACPKLDDVEPYIKKLAMVFANHRINSIMVAKMEVPCCTGIASVVMAALEQARVDIPVRVVTVGIRGEILHESIERPRLAAG